MLCCTKCPFVFCKECVRSNLSIPYAKRIEENDNWSCFVCNPDLLRKHRAQHWALRNFMTKQLEKIKTTGQRKAKLNNLFNEDASNCCRVKKRKSLSQKPVAPLEPVKRPAESMDSDEVTAHPPSKRRSAEETSEKAPPPPVSSASLQSSADCARMRNNQGKRPDDTSAVPEAPAISHNISGLHFNLKKASRQEYFRLPPYILSGSNVLTLNNVNVKGPHFKIKQTVTKSTAASIPDHFIGPDPVQQTDAPPPPMPMKPIAASHHGPIVLTPIQLIPAGSSIFTQQNGSISIARAPQPDTPFAKAKTAFEDVIISGLEVCQNTITKLITLSNSTSFRETRSFSDLKGLYVHLDYLYRFSSEKIKTLQQEVTEGMRSLESTDAASKEKTSVEELIILDEETDTVEELIILDEETDVVEVLSDNDETAAPKVRVESALPKFTYAPGPASAVKKLLFKHTQYTAKSIVPVPANISSDLASNDFTRSARIEDGKLKFNTLVRVERLENSKDVAVKQHMTKLQESFEAVSGVAADEETLSASKPSDEETSDLMLPCPETEVTEIPDEEVDPIEEALETFEIETVARDAASESGESSSVKSDGIRNTKIPYEYPPKPVMSKKASETPRSAYVGEFLDFVQTNDKRRSKLDLKSGIRGCEGRVACNQRLI